MNSRTGIALVLGLFLALSRGQAAELILPQNRNAFHSREIIELAVAGLARDATGTLEFVPQQKGLTPLKVTLQGDGSTVTVLLPRNALAPSVYTLRLDGKNVGQL